jgi:hypothetical protein
LSNRHPSRPFAITPDNVSIVSSFGAPFHEAFAKSSVHVTGTYRNEKEASRSSKRDGTFAAPKLSGSAMTTVPSLISIAMM